MASYSQFYILEGNLIIFLPKFVLPEFFSLIGLSSYEPKS